MNKTYWIITEFDKLPIIGRLEEAIDAAMEYTKRGIKATILCEGNIVWIG